MNKNLTEQDFYDSKIWENLTLSDNYIFQKFMLNPEICKKVLSEILNRKVVDINYPEYEKTIDIRQDSKSIRLDVYLEGDEDVYNIEMQATKDKYLPKRGRYYQDLIDLDLLEKGYPYDELKNSFVIFICTFDFYGQDQYIYTFTNKCNNNTNLEYSDDTTKIVVNTKGHIGDISEDFKDFLNAVNGVFSNTEFSAKIKEEVINIKMNKKWRREYMTLYLREQQLIRDWERKGMEQGLAQGIEQGLAQGMEQGLAQGMEQGRTEEREIAIKNMLRELSPDTIIGFGYDAELVLKLVNESQ